MSVELGSVWIDNDSDLLVIVKSLEAKFDGKVTVIFNYIVRTGDKFIESASELELFLNTKTKLVRHNESDYSRGYEDGYNSGKNQWQDDYGFTVPNNTIQSLEKAAYAKGLKDKEGINNSVKYQEFKKGYDKAKELYESLHDWDNKEQFEAGLKEGKEFNKDDQNLNYRTGYNDGWHDCEASFELGNDFTDSIQEQAYDEGYDQAIDDLIKAGVIEEEEYSDEDDYSEYEFGDVEGGEEEYCFSKELDKILNSDQAQYTIKAEKFADGGKEEGVWKDSSAKGYDFKVEENGAISGFRITEEKDGASMGNRYDENGKLSGFFINTGNEKIGGIKGSERKHSHYFKDVRHLDYIDVYQVCKLFPVDDDSGAITHARKKLLVAGGRGAGKDMIKDITEARDTLNRYLQIEGIEK